MRPRPSNKFRLSGYLYPGPHSSGREVIVALTWSGVLGIVMVIGLFIDHGWFGRLGALVVLVALVGPLWISTLRLLRSGERR